MQQLLIVAELKLFKYFLIYVTFHVLCLYFLLYHQRAFPVHLSTGSICVLRSKTTISLFTQVI